MRFFIASLPPFLFIYGGRVRRGLVAIRSLYVQKSGCLGGTNRGATRRGCGCMINIFIVVRSYLVKKMSFRVFEITGENFKNFFSNLNAYNMEKDINYITI